MSLKSSYISPSNRRGRRSTASVASVLLVIATLAGLVFCTGCGASSAPDPRCRIETTGSARAQIAKSVNGSDLWQTYLDAVQPSGSTPVVELKLDMERHTRKSYGGDYDPGTITVEFVAKSLRNGRRLVKQEAKFALDDFMIGSFDPNATREEIQELAFQDGEENIYPYLDRWVNLAAIRAMGFEGTGGYVFVPVLTDLIEEDWTSGDMRAAARQALNDIRGST